MQYFYINILITATLPGLFTFFISDLVMRIQLEKMMRYYKPQHYGSASKNRELVVTAFPMSKNFHVISINGTEIKGFVSAIISLG